YILLNGLLWQAVPDSFGHDFQFCFICRLRHVGFIFLNHSPPDMKVKRVKIWRIGWPFIFLDELWGILFEELLRKTGRVSWRAILLEDEVAIWRQLLAVTYQLWKKIIYVVFCINLCFLGNKV